MIEKRGVVELFPVIWSDSFYYTMTCVLISDLSLFFPIVNDSWEHNNISSYVDMIRYLRKIVNYLEILSRRYIVKTDALHDKIEGNRIIRVLHTLMVLTNRRMGPVP